MQIAICGVGRVGQEIAIFLVKKGLNIILYDINKELLKAEKIELEIAKRIFKSKSIIEITDKPPKADIYIVSAGKPRKNVNEKFDFLYNLKTVKESIINADINSPILVITNPTTSICNALKKSGYTNVIKIGDHMDKLRIKLYGSVKEPRRIVMEGKGFTSHGVTAEVLDVIHKLLNKSDKL